MKTESSVSFVRAAKSTPSAKSFATPSSGRRAVVALGLILLSVWILVPVARSASVASWIFTGVNNAATVNAAAVNSGLTAPVVLTRGAGAGASAGLNSFRTVGFQNNGISTANTDYFEFALVPAAGFTLSLSTLDAVFAGTATFAASPGVTGQFAYSVGGPFILIGSPFTTVGTPATMTQISLAGISALQSIPAGTPVTFRYYASGQTATGGWGFTSTTGGAVGLDVGGTLTPTGGGGGGASKILVVLPGQNFVNAVGVTGAPATVTAGSPFSIAMVAVNNANTIDASYTQPAAITIVGPGGTPTYNTTGGFSSGMSSATVTLTKAETTTLTATAIGLTGQASSPLNVGPGVASKLQILAPGETAAPGVSPGKSGTPSSRVAGSSFTVTVNAVDANWNAANSSDTIRLTSTDGAATLPADTALAGGTATLSVTLNTTPSATVTASDLTDNTKTASTTPSLLINPLTKYRSKQSGNWSDFTTWQADAGSGFVDAVSGQTPTSADSTVDIRNGHTIAITTAVSIDQVTINSGGQLTNNVAVTFTVNNGTGDDIVVQNGGVLALAAAPTFSSGATANINTGGILRVAATGLTGAGAGVNAASFIYQNGSILEYALTSSFSASGVTYFPNADASTVPIFRVTATPGAVGGGTATAINGVFEVSSANTVTWTGAGTKTFRNGIRGTGSVAQGTAGQFILSGTTADLGGGTLTLGAGGLQINSGTVATLSSDKTVDTTAGTFTVAGSLDLGGKILTSTATVASGGVLKGNGTASGVVTVNSGGTMAPGNSVGTITLSSTPVLSGTNLMEIDRNGGSPIADKVVRSGGALTYGGTLTVNNIGTTLTGGETFDLFDATSFNGAFAATNLPSLGAGLNWWTGNLPVDGTIKVNRAPTASSSSASANLGDNITLPGFKLLVTAADADGDTLNITAASASAGSASVVSGNVQYTTPVTGTSDVITYTVSDSLGGTANGTINVTLTPAASQGFNQMSPPVVLNNGDLVFTYLGIPGFNYALDRSFNLTPPVTWTPQVTNPAGPNGAILFTNTPDATTNNYWRTRYVQ